MSHVSNKVEWCIKKAQKEKEMDTEDFKSLEAIAKEMIEQTKKIIQ